MKKFHLQGSICFPEAPTLGLGKDTYRWLLTFDFFPSSPFFFPMRICTGRVDYHRALSDRKWWRRTLEHCPRTHVRLGLGLGSVASLLSFISLICNVVHTLQKGLEDKMRKADAHGNNWTKSSCYELGKTHFIGKNVKPSVTISDLGFRAVLHLPPPSAMYFSSSAGYFVTQSY